MKTIKQLGFQGDLTFRRVPSVPEGMRAVDGEGGREGGRHVLAHSETGHHHVVAADGTVRYVGDDPMVCYLRIDGVGATIEHLRPWDTHAPVMLDGGGAVYEVRRQREWTPEGERMVQD